jgi:hypothetical protein
MDCWAQNYAHCKTPYYSQKWLLQDSKNENERIAYLKKIEEFKKQSPNKIQNTVLVVPVVFHVLYENQNQNIPDSKIQLQLDILNKDYRKRNTDTLSTPSAFKSLAADLQIEFCLAKRDPHGNPTNGIERRLVSINEIGSTQSFCDSLQGGLYIWDRDSYLNIWVCEIEAIGATLGYCSVPSFNPPAKSDGVVIDYRYIGSSSNIHYNKGRTATHEIGHWFDLQHIWGDDFGLCSIDDGIADTPPQTLEHYGVPVFPSLDSCSPIFPGTMFMNFLDYTDDVAMNIFTQGQKQHVWAALQTSLRDSLFHSLGCQPVGIEEEKSDFKMHLSANPCKDYLTIKLMSSKTGDYNFDLIDVVGNIIYSAHFKGVDSFDEKLDLTKLAAGLYFIKLTSKDRSICEKIIKE